MILGGRHRGRAPLRSEAKGAATEGVVKVNKKELERYKRLLLKKREDILGQLHHIARDTLNRSQREASGDLSGYAYHMADVATDSYDREFSLDIASNEREVLIEIDEALRRIDEGTYGTCQECGKGISKMRLKALPHASLCLACQKKKEIKRG